MKYHLYDYVVLILLFTRVAVANDGGESPTYHKNFTLKELLEVFSVNHPDRVPKYASAKINGLQKLNDSHPPLSLKAFGKDFNFKISPNKRVLADTHTVEFVSQNGKIAKYAGAPGEFSTGTLDNDALSSISLFHSGKGVSGSILTSDDFYIINPLPHRVKSNDSDHIIYRLSDMDDERFLKNYLLNREKISKDARKLHQTGKSLDEPKAAPKGSFLTAELNNLGIVNSAIPLSNTNLTQVPLPKKTAEIMIAADYTMVKHLSKEFLPTYMLAVANIVAGFYRDPTSEYPLDIVVMRSVIFETDILEAPNVGSLLTNFSAWVQANNNMNNSAENHVDAALLLTRNGCDDGCGYEGFALLDPRCSPKAQAVTKDRGLMSAIIVAHELGHILGLSHDGDGSNHCKIDLNIMAEGITPGGGVSMRWSKCSSKALADFLKSSRSACLDDLPPTKPITNSKFQLYGTIYNATQQCQFIYGDEYHLCPQLTHRCDNLFCQRKDAKLTCESFLFPAAQGTECGAYKWCIDGTCVPDGRTPEPPIDGGWSNWSDYGACSKPCGIGVQWRTRNCSNPAPAHGGAWCGKTGSQKMVEHSFHKTCNMQSCSPEVNDRDVQCDERKPGTINCDYCNADPCLLICGTRYSGFGYGIVMSGTACKAMDIPNGRGICVEEKCTEIGCDKRIHSGRELDRCGVCNGNGDSCHRLSGRDDKPYSSFGSYYLTTIPVNTTFAEVRELQPTMAFLGVKAGDSNEYRMKIPQPSNSVVDNNMKIVLDMRAFNYPDKLTFTALTDVASSVPYHVYFVNYYAYNFPVQSHGIVWQGMTQGRGNNSLTVQWKVEAWSSCSKECAGGTQQRKSYCQRTDDLSRASDEACLNALGPKPATERRCNTGNCSPRWYISGWSSCSKSCATGTKMRTIKCGQKTNNGTIIYLEDSLCAEVRPTDATAEACNIVDCPARWRALSALSPCSKSCGEGGVSTREIGCRRTNSTGHDLVVSNLECTNAVPLNETEACNTDVFCPQWDVIYSPCSASCGEGVRQPVVICSGSVYPVSPSKCELADKPDASKMPFRTCNLSVCREYAWGLRRSQCTVTCGKGVIVTTVYCYDTATKEDVDSSKCDVSKIMTVTPVETCDAGKCSEEIVYQSATTVPQTTACGAGAKVEGDKSNRRCCICKKKNTTDRSKDTKWVKSRYYI